MQKAEGNDRLRKRWLIGALVFMLGQLAFFKYTNFLLGTLAGFGLFSPDVKLDLPLLIGISFFTFRPMSYIIDVYRRQMEPTRSITDFAFFVSFFPTLLAGPILRARTFLPELRRPVVVTHQMMGVGTWFIIMGLFKKCIISDYISTNFVSRIFDNPALYSGLENLLGVYGYALQLYCDFSGYSDMAIGIALWMGFHIPANFRAPYKSDSITDFLATLAHFAVNLATRLPLHLIRRQPLQPLAYVFQSVHDHAFGRFMAWSLVEFCDMGQCTRRSPLRP